MLYSDIYCISGVAIYSIISSFYLAGFLKAGGKSGGSYGGGSSVWKSGGSSSKSGGWQSGGGSSGWKSGGSSKGGSKGGKTIKVIKVIVQSGNGGKGKISGSGKSSYGGGRGGGWQSGECQITSRCFMVNAVQLTLMGECKFR